VGTKCCLLIDDDLDDQELFCLAAKEADMDVVCICANDGLEGLEKLAQPQAIIPDYIFIDLNMPRMNGIDSLREIKKLPYLNESRIIIYSTSIDEKSRTESKALGVDKFLIKPAGFDKMKEELKKIFKASSDSSGDEKSESHE